MWMKSWNVVFMLKTRKIAGVYQLDDLLSVADLLRELAILTFY